MWNKIRDAVKRLPSMRSLKARIFIIIMLVGTIPSILMRYGILKSYEERAVYQRQKVVQNSCQSFDYLQLSSGCFFGSN